MKFILPLVAIAAFAAVPVQAQTKTADPHQHPAGGATAAQPAAPAAPKSGATDAHDHGAGQAGGGQGSPMMEGKCCCDDAKMRQMMSEMMPQMMRQMMPQMMNQMMGHGAPGAAGQPSDHADHPKP